MIHARIRNQNEYLNHLTENSKVYDRIRQVEADYDNNGKDDFFIHGFSYPAGIGVEFLVDHLYAEDNKINWRERVLCAVTSLNSRLRACIHFIDFELNAKSNSHIYIAEQLTPLYDYLNTRFINLTGSEFLGPDAIPGSVNDKGIRHEDATKLSFEDSALDYYMSFECFEHIPDYMQAFREAFRVLKKGGMLYFTVPFDEGINENQIRATIASDGTITHLMPPEYHGDPVNPEGGILCFTRFGWQMFDQLREIGFSDAYALTFWSDSLGYFGRQFLFCARK